MLLLYYLDAIILIGIIALGYLIGTIVYVVAETAIEFDNFIVYLVIVGLVILLCILLREKIENALIIVTSAVYGALLTVRGFGIYTGSFPDETYISSLLHHSEFSQFKRELLALLALNAFLLAVLIIPGILIQNSLSSDEKPSSSQNSENKDENDKENPEKNKKTDE